MLLNIASSFHVDHELVDFVPVGEPEYDEVIEEYEEEIFAQDQEAQEPAGGLLFQLSIFLSQRISRNIISVFQQSELAKGSILQKHVLLHCRG